MLLRIKELMLIKIVGLSQTDIRDTPVQDPVKGIDKGIDQGLDLARDLMGRTGVTGISLRIRTIREIRGGGREMITLMVVNILKGEHRLIGGEQSMIGTKLQCIIK